MSDVDPTDPPVVSPSPSASEPPPISDSSSSESISPTSEPPPPSSSSSSSETPPSSTSSPSSSVEPPPSSSSSSTQSPTESPTSSPSPSSSSFSPSPDPTSSSTFVPSSSSSSPPSSSSVTTPPPTTSIVIVSPTVTPTLISQPPSGLYVTTDSAGSTYTGSLTLVPSVSDGKTIFVTQVVKGTPTLDGGSASRHGGSDFFDNTGAVAGVFVVVGLVVTGFLAAFTWYMLRRRRRQRLDRDVAAAAAAAAANQHPRFEDDDEPGMAQYNGYYATHSGEIEGQQPQNPHTRGYDYEDPAGGYDPYAANLVDVPLNGGNGGMDRMSTATAPGFAGYGAGHAYYQNPQNTDPIDFTQQQQQQQQHADFKHSYGDPQYDVAHNYAGPDEPLAGHGEQTSYNYYNYEDEPHGGIAYPAPAAQGLARPESVGSIASGANANHRDLTVTNK